MSEKTATLHSVTVTSRFQYAATYMLSEPVTYTKIESAPKDKNGYTEREFTTSLVWVSSVHLLTGGLETMVFPCDAAGTVLNWGDLAVTQTWSHADALAELGFTITNAIDAIAKEPAPRQIGAPESDDETA